VASLSQGRTAAAQCGLFTHKSVPVIFEPPCISITSKCFGTKCHLHGVYIRYKFILININQDLAESEGKSTFPGSCKLLLTVGTSKFK